MSGFVYFWRFGKSEREPVVCLPVALRAAAAAVARSRRAVEFGGVVETSQEREARWERRGCRAGRVCACGSVSFVFQSALSKSRSFSSPRPRGRNPLFLVSPARIPYAED